jgi:hypothetical protein
MCSWSIPLVVLICACGGGIQTPLESAGEARSIPDGLVVVYDDYHPQWGGKRIVVQADRSIEVEQWRPNQPENAPDSWRGTVPEEAMKQLVRLLLEIEAWEQQAEEDATRIDDAKARLEVRVGGEGDSIWEWANDLQANGRIVRIQQHLEALAFEARHPLAP